MKSPISGKEMTLKYERRNLVFRKESFEVTYQYYLCADSGEQFETDELSDMNLIQVYNKYREKHKLPFPEEIIAIREKYGVSASKMSEILGFGTNTYRNYEQGEVPASANAKLIQLIKDPREFCRLIKLSSISDSKSVGKIIRNAKSLHERRSRNDNPIKIILYSGKPNIYNGYRRLKLNKLFELISYFANQIVPWKTQLNKLLFYTDFICYKRTGYSLTGLQYYAIPLSNAYLYVASLLSRSIIFARSLMENLDMDYSFPKFSFLSASDHRIAFISIAKSKKSPNS